MMGEGDGRPTPPFRWDLACHFLFSSRDNVCFAVVYIFKSERSASHATGSLNQPASLSGRSSEYNSKKHHSQKRKGSKPSRYIQSSNKEPQ